MIMYYDNELNMTVFTDIEYIKIGIANNYGKDKELWATRLDWVNNKSIEELWALADEADEPYQYRKALHALQDAQAGKATGYTVGLDSTSSGAQIFAILSGCKKSAKAVNLINDGIRHDLYTDIKNQLAIDAPRSDVKEAVMTAFYQSEARPEEVFGDEVGVFYKTLEENMPGAWEILQLTKAAQACITDHYAFRNPSGHDVLVRQKVVCNYKVEAKTGLDWTTNYHFTQQRKEFGLKQNHKGEPSDRSISAAIAHVCDAWFANTLVDVCKTQYGFEVYHIFDQFFCSPKHMNRLRLVARELLAQLAESNWLEEALQDITQDKTFKYTKHSDDLADEIRKCDYFIN